MRKIVVATRQSALALTQTEQTVDKLRQICLEHGIECEFELKKVVTKGDRILDVALSKVGGKGLFVKEIEQALLDGDADIAIHSMKDMPAVLPDGLVIGCVPLREDPRDAIITRDGRGLDALPQGALVGTSSLRRSSQLQHLRPDTRVESLRGNIDSRLRKLESEGFDAILLAAAGLRRMGWGDRISELLSPDRFVPAVGQGALCIEARADDTFVLELLGRLQHEPTALAVRAERALLSRLEGGCQVPIGAYATLAPFTSASEPQALAMTAVVGSPDGIELLRAAQTGSGAAPEQLGLAVAEELLARGADRILAAGRV